MSRPEIWNASICTSGPLPARHENKNKINYVERTGTGCTNETIQRIIDRVCGKWAMDDICYLTTSPKLASFKLHHDFKLPMILLVEDGLVILVSWDRTLSHSPSKYNLMINSLHSSSRSSPHLDKASSNSFCSCGGYMRFSQAQSISEGLLFLWNSEPSSVHSRGIGYLESIVNGCS